MLNAFNQKLIMENEHFIAIDEQEYPQKFQPILRRLNMATQDATVKQQMETEDVIIDELRLWDINLQRMKKIAEEAEADLEKAEGELQKKRKELQKTENELQMKDSELQMKDSELQMKDSELQMKDSELQMKDSELQMVKSEAEKSALNEKINSARTLVSQGVPKETVVIAFGISLEVLEQWLGNK